MGFRIPGEGDAIRKRIDRVKQAQEAQESIVERRIAHLALEEETRQFVARMEYDLMLSAGQILERLEAQRDANRPKAYGEEWNPGFRNAVEQIPEARRFLEEMTIRCIRSEDE